jgi:hypothetical protein
VASSNPEPDLVRFPIPAGYAELPLTDITAKTDATARLIAELGTAEQQLSGNYLLQQLAFLLDVLGQQQAVYCGLGRHRSAIDGTLITSTLVVTVIELPGRRNPKLVLRDLLEADARDGEPAQIDLVELRNGPAMFTERVRLMPTPAHPGQQPGAAGAASPVWQLTASLPSPHGDHLATVEVSTPFPEHGPQYRPMTVDMTAALTFGPAPERDPLEALLG